MKRFAIAVIVLAFAIYVPPALCQDSGWSDELLGWLPEGPYRMLQFVDVEKAFTSDLAAKHTELFEGIFPHKPIAQYFGTEVEGNVKAVLVADFFQEIEPEEDHSGRLPYRDVYFGIIRVDSVGQLLMSLEDRFAHEQMNIADGEITLDSFESDVPFAFTRIKKVFFYTADAQTILFAESPEHIEAMLKANLGEVSTILESEHYTSLAKLVPSAYYWTIMPYAPTQWFAAEKKASDPVEVDMIREESGQSLLFRMGYRELKKEGFVIHDATLYADEESAKSGMSFPVPSPYPANGSKDIEKYNSEMKKRTKITVDETRRIRSVEYDLAFIELEQKVQELRSQPRRR